MTRTWTISQKLLAGSIALVLMVVATGAIATWGTSVIRARAQDTLATSAIVKQAGDLKQLNSEIFAAERSMMLGALAGDDQMLSTWTERLQQDLQAAQAKSATLATSLKGTPNGVKAAEIQKNIAAWGERCDHCHEFADKIKTDPARVIDFSRKGETLMQASHDVLGAIVATQEKAFADQSAAASSAYTSARVMMVGALLLSVLVGAVVVFVVRRISDRLRVTAESLRAGTMQVGTTATQVSGSAQSLSKGSTEQAASLEETSASMEELTAMTRQNAERAGSATELMVETDDHVRHSNAALTEMTISMASIREASARVSAIIKTIDQIAFQTNILALNAAVEAARAGEAGMGFAVVADEVRALAQRSAQAAGDTAALIAESMQKSAEGATKVEQVAAAIAEVTENVGKVKGLIEEVSSASEQQSQGIVQIAQAITQMERVTQQIAATAEESAAASEALHAQVRQTTTLVGDLDAMVHGMRGEAAADLPVEQPHQEMRHAA